MESADPVPGPVESAARAVVIPTYDFLSPMKELSASSLTYSVALGRAVFHL